MIWNLLSKAKDLFYSNSGSGLEADNVQGAIDEVNNSKEDLMTKNVSDRFINAQGTVASHMQLMGLYDKTTQKTLSGKNLWDEQYQKGYYNDSGVFVSDTRFVANANPIYVDSTKQYCFSQDVTNELFMYDVDDNYLGKNVCDDTTKIFANLNANTAYVCFRTNTAYGNTYNNDIAFMMYTVGMDISYEKYCGGEPSPNPQYPQDIIGVGMSESIDIVSENANLLNLDDCNFAYCIKQSDGTVKSNISTQPYCVITNKKINELLLLNRGKTLYFSCKGNTPGILGIVIYGERANGQPIQEVLKTTERISITIANDFTEITHIDLHFNFTGKVADTTTVLSDFMLSFEDTDYIPYQSTKATLTTGLPLYAVKNANGNVEIDGEKYYADMLVRYKDGSGKVVKNTDEIEITSDMKFYDVDATYGFFTANVKCNVAPWETNILSTHFHKPLAGIGLNGNGWLQFDGTSKPRFKIDGISTIEALKTWLDSNTPKIIFPTTSPTEIPLTSEEVDELLNLRSYDGVTNVYNSDGACMEVRYAVTENGAKLLGRNIVNTDYELLWTNPDPTVEIGLTTIPLGRDVVSKYPAFLITAFNNTAQAANFSESNPPSKQVILYRRPFGYLGGNNNSGLWTIGSKNSVGHIFGRNVAITSNADIAFQVCTAASLVDGTISQENTALIPYQVFGIKYKTE